MDGVHDLGGMHGFGPVRPDTDEPLFHAPWEERVLAVTLATGALGRWTIDRSRFTRESLPPAIYLSSSYYEIWLRGLERLLVESGLLAADDLGPTARADLPEGAGSAHDTAATTSTAPAPGTASTAPAPGTASTAPAPGTASTAPAPGTAVAVPWERLQASLDAGTPYVRDVAGGPAFAAGERVRTCADHPAGHTRLPRYARGKVGTVLAVRGAHVFADRNAVPAGTPAPGEARWLYTVEFDGPTLWGADADPTSSVTVDAWEPCLAAADAS